MFYQKISEKILGKYSWEIMKNIPEKFVALGVPR